MQYIHLKIANENTAVLSDCLTLLFQAILPSQHTSAALTEYQAFSPV